MFWPLPSHDATCEAAYSTFVTTTFAADKGPQEEALKEIHALAPKAKIFVIGYPEIVEATNACAGFPWHADDLKWFRDKVQKVGNKMIQAGAKANGATFVNTFKPSEGHNSCKKAPGSGEPERWIEPLLGSLTGVPVHPNALGEQNLGQLASQFGVPVEEILRHLANHLPDAIDAMSTKGSLAKEGSLAKDLGPE